MRYIPGIRRESNGAIPVNVQDQTSQALDLYFIKAVAATTTLAANVNPDDKSITVTSTVGFTAGVHILISSNITGNFTFANQIGAPVGNVINLDRPVDKSYVIGENVTPNTNNLAVDGSTTTQIFTCGELATSTNRILDITRLMGYIQDDTIMDDAKFGGGSPLIYGIQLRVNNGVIHNIWNCKINGDFSLLCYDLEYTAKAPAGSYGLRFRNTYAGQHKHGVALRIYPGDCYQLLIQDDLTGLEKFNIMLQGHVAEN